MDSRSYRRALAECVVQAADRGLIPRELRVGKRFKLSTMATLPGALMLIGSLCASDVDRERWAAVEPLSPEINACIGYLRRMERAEDAMHEGEAELGRLRSKTAASPAAGVHSA